MRTAAVVLSVLAAIGCSGGDDPEDAPTTAAPTDTATLETATAAPSPAPADDATAAPTDSAETYTVQSGDTLTELARRFDTTVEAIVEANDLDDPDVIEVGEELVVPTGDGGG